MTLRGDSDSMTLWDVSAALRRCGARLSVRWAGGWEATVGTPHWEVVGMGQSLEAAVRQAFDEVRVFCQEVSP